MTVDLLNLSTRARDFASVLIADVQLASGEAALDHAVAVAAIAAQLDNSDELQAACYLLYAVDSLNKPLEVLTKQFGEGVARLAVETRQLIAVQERSKGAASVGAGTAGQTENIRKMLLAFGRDLRVVLLRLASRLQTLRFYALTKMQPPEDLACVCSAGESAGTRSDQVGIGRPELSVFRASCLQTNCRYAGRKTGRA
jgi:GTP pyrophosphokinase